MPTALHFASLLSSLARLNVSYCSFRRRIRRASGFSEADPRQPDRFGQQRQQRPALPLYAWQMHHRDFRNIRWIAKNDVFRVYMGPRHPAAPASFLFCRSRTTPRSCTDSERTIQLRRDFLVDGRFESIQSKVAIKMIATTIQQQKAT